MSQTTTQTSVEQSAALVLPTQRTVADRPTAHPTRWNQPAAPVQRPADVPTDEAIAVPARSGLRALLSRLAGPAPTPEQLEQAARRAATAHQARGVQHSDLILVQAQVLRGLR